MFIFDSIKLAKIKTGKTIVSKEIPKAKDSLIYSEDKISAYSKLLDRDVSVTILLPPNFASSPTKIPLLLLNDGQDMDKLGVKTTVERLIEEEQIENLIVQE